MDNIVFNSTDITLFNLIEDSLNDNSIPYMVTGSGKDNIIKVSDEYVEAALEIIRNLRPQ